MMSAAILRFTHSAFFDIAQSIRCHVLLVVAKEQGAPLNQAHLNTAIEIYKQKCASFKMIEVPGNHFVHLNEPQNLAEDITEFLSKDLPDFM